MSTPRTVFAEEFDSSRLDREPFVTPHGLLGHPALALDNLAILLKELPKEQVFYSSGQVGRGANFDRAHLDHQTGLSLAETIECIRTSNSYIMVRAPESHPLFRGLFDDIKEAVQVLARQRGVGEKVVDPMLYLFIASPGAITPFHIDRYSTFLFQFRGKKDMYVYPAFDSRLVEPEIAESFVVWAGGRPTYRPELDYLATKFSFSPGEVLHIPFLAPHHVQNGTDDVSISLSIIFSTEETARTLAAYRLNHKLRKLMKRFGVSPSPIGSHPLSDNLKAQLHGLASYVRRAGRPFATNLERR